MTGARPALTPPLPHPAHHPPACITSFSAGRVLMQPRVGVTTVAPTPFRPLTGPVTQTTTVGPGGVRTSATVTQATPLKPLQGPTTTTGEPCSQSGTVVSHAGATHCPNINRSTLLPPRALTNQLSIPSCAPRPSFRHPLQLPLDPTALQLPRPPPVLPPCALWRALCRPPRSCAVEQPS